MDPASPNPDLRVSIERLARTLRSTLDRATPMVAAATLESLADAIDLGFVPTATDLRVMAQHLRAQGATLPGAATPAATGVLTVEVIVPRGGTADGGDGGQT